MKKTVLIVPHNHFDPVWRRRFRGKTELNGVKTASYSEVEGLVIDRWNEYSQPFTEGQTAVIREYMSTPEREEKLKNAIETGRFFFSGGGETVQDCNLPAPEGLIRNFLVGYPERIKLLSDKNDVYERVVWLEDIFGLSANYPQILKKTGAVAGCRFCYKTPSKKVWEGIDSSRIAVLDRFFAESGVGTFEKHPPCTCCGGAGCEKCGGTGMKIAPEIGYEALYGAISGAVNLPEVYTVLYVGGEEMMPEKGLCEAVKRAAIDFPQANIILGSALDAYKSFEKEINSELENGESTFGELNPVFSGCYTSRSEIKQRLRDITYRLCFGESLIAARRFAGEKACLPEGFDEAWKNVTFCQFHDTVTGTLCDGAYNEAMDMLSRAESAALSLCPDSAECSQVCVEKSDGKIINGNTLLWGKTQITLEDSGITRILYGSDDLFGVRGYGRLRRPFRIGELCLEPDFGDAWSTRISPWFSPHDNQSLLQLGDYQRLAQLSPDKAVWHGVYRNSSFAAPAADPMVKTLEWTVTLHRGENDEPVFEAEINWDTRSKRLRVVFPVNDFSDSALYEIPFGSVKRTYDPQTVCYGGWSDPDTMDFPAQNWVMKTVGENKAVAIFNRGIPSFRWIPGCFEMSLLRSSESLFCANEPRNYEFPDFDGLRDTGRHLFRYSVRPFDAVPDEYTLTGEGLRFNLPQGLNIPFDITGRVNVTAFKPAQRDAHSVVLRFYNPSAEDTEVNINFGKGVTVTSCDMLERPSGNGSERREYKYTAKKYEIVTLLITVH